MNNNKRQHPIWMIYQLSLSFKDVIIPIIIFFIINYQNDALWVKLGSIGLIIYFIYQIISIFFQWKNQTYYVTNRNLEMNEGRFITKKRYVSLNRIQSYQQHASFLHRLFHLTSLSILTGTTSSENATIKLDMISKEEAERIIQIIQTFDQHREDEKTSTIPPRLHYSISWQEIFYISLTSLYFLVIFPVILSLYFKLDELFSLDVFTMKALNFITQSWMFIVAVAIIVVLFAIISGIIFTYLRFGNYKVSTDEEHIYISKGVLNKTNFVISRKKINGVVIEKNFPRRLFKIVKVKTISLGDLLEEADMQTDVLFPFIHEKRLNQLLPNIIPEYKMQESMNSLPSQAMFVNLIQPSYSLVIITFLVFYFWPEYWFIPFAYAISLIAFRIVKTNQTKYGNNHPFIQFQSGVLFTETFMTKRTKIDVLEVDQSWLERKLHLASLSITTRAKPVHISRIEHIPASHACKLYNWYKNYAYFCNEEEHFIKK